MPSGPPALWPSFDTPYLSQVLDSGAKIILTQDGVMRGSKLVPLKGIVDEAIPLIVAAGGEDPRTVVLRRLGEEDLHGDQYWPISGSRDPGDLACNQQSECLCLVQRRRS